MEIKIRTEDYNAILRNKPNMFKKLRELTLHVYSGMNHELNNMERIFLKRDVDCKIMTAYFDRKLVGWALLSKEKSDFPFHHVDNGFNSKMGTLFEIYISPSVRRKGIGEMMVKEAKKNIGASKLCVCPWNITSTNFYNKFKDLVIL